jgi:hypothetical protein
MVPHRPFTHVGVMHSFEDTGQSLGEAQAGAGQQSRAQAVHDSRRPHTPLPQNSLEQLAQSSGQLAQVSLPSHTPLPQPEHTPQSRSQVTQVSFLPHTPLPQ